MQTHLSPKFSLSTNLQKKSLFYVDLEMALDPNTWLNIEFDMISESIGIK